MECCSSKKGGRRPFFIHRLIKLAKREAMLADTSIFRRPRPVELSRVQRFVGRITHMASVLPDLQTPLRAGYHIIGVNGGNFRSNGKMVFTQGRLPSQVGFQCPF